MKRHIYYLLAALVVAGFTACSEDKDWGIENESLIQVIKSDVLFQAAAGTGTVVFNASEAVTVETDCSWCTATINGNTVNVSVTENGNLEGRTSQLILRCGSDSVHVMVQQTGLVFQLSAGSEIATNSDEAHSLTYEMSANVPLTFEPDGDWFNVTSDGEQLIINFKENTTGHARIGILKYSSETFSGSLKVTQYDFDKDIAGPCYLTFYTQAGKFQAMNAVLSETGLTLPDYGWTIPVTFEPEKVRFVMYNAREMGEFEGNNVYNIVEGSGYYTWSATVYMLFPLDYDAESGITFFDMQDTGTWSRPIDFMSFRVFNGAPSSATSVGSLLKLYNPSIWRETPQ